MPDLVIGGVPRGEDYFGQDELIENIWSKLEHDNVLLVAPRRFGKTGAMYRLLDEPRKSFRPIYMDVESIESPADFMIELVANLIKDHHFTRVLDTLWRGSKVLGNFIRNLPADIDLGGVKIKLREKTDVPEKWLSYGERVMSLLSKDGAPLLLLIDEFAVMINTFANTKKHEMEQLLRWFRRARTAPDTQTRFVIGGSINLISTLDSIGLVETVNDLALERILPFDHQTAKQYLEAIFTTHELELQSEISTLIIDLVGEPIPYLLAVLLSSIFNQQRATKHMISKEMVKDAFENDLLGGAASAFFRQYRSRIDQYYSEKEASAAKAILRTLSRVDSPVREDTIYQVYLKTVNIPPSSETQEDFMQLMHKLDNDFYVVARDGTYAFFSRVIQLWWKNHYGFQGV